MDPNNPIQQLLLRGLGTTSLVRERLRSVTQDWVRSGKLDPNQASALVDEVLKALRGDTPELEEQAGRQLERNKDQLLQDLGLARQRELDELRGRLDRLEQTLRQELSQRHNPSGSTVAGPACSQPERQNSSGGPS